LGFFYAIKLNEHLKKKQMQQLQHKYFTMWNEQSSLPIRYSYVPAGSGFTAIGNMSNNDKIRPWFKR
jgi:hypothetical protein